MTQSDVASNESTSSKKPARNPVERVIVWGVIAVSLVVVAIEFRAKRGYDSSLAYIQQRVDDYNDAGDQENVAPLRMTELKEQLSGGPSLGAVEKSTYGERTMSIRWFSLFKHYELILVVNNDTDQGIVFNVKPADPAAD